MPSPPALTPQETLEQALDWLRQGQPHTAIGLMQQALAGSPASVDRCQDLGTVLLLAGQNEAALAAYEQALALQPDLAQAHMNRGNALLALQRVDEAIASYRAALAQQPGLADAHHNLGLAFLQCAQPARAVATFRDALRYQPDHWITHNSLGHALMLSGEPSSALAHFQQATSLQPDFADAWFNQCLALLQTGRLEEGWRLHHWRWRASFFHSPALASSRPAWRPGLACHNLWIWPEQGVGDEILFCGFLPEARGLAPSLQVQADARLLPLLARSFPDLAFHPRHEPADATRYDAHMPMGDLPVWLWQAYSERTTARQAYLQADPARAQALRAQLAHPGKQLYGISWASLAKYPAGRRLALAELLRALARPDVLFVNLQYGDVAAEINAAAAETGIPVACVESIDNWQDLDGLAALVAACDQVISMANVTVHLAGALGKETAALVPFAPSWRWQRGQHDNPWYRSVRLYHQARAEDWSAALAQLAADLARPAQP